MAANDDVLIVGKLDDSELTKSIDKLVNYVDNQTSVMASSFVTSMDLMRGAMKDFAVTQKVSVDLMKESWKEMSASFDAMFKAQSESTGGGKGSGRATYPDNTVGALEQEIAEETKLRKEMELGSKELRDQNAYLEQRKKLLKSETTSDAVKIQKQYAADFKEYTNMSDASLSKAQAKLAMLVDLQDRMRKSGLVDQTALNRVEKAIDTLSAKIKRLKAGGGSSPALTLNDVLGMDEKGFDAIAKKMSALKKLSWSNPQEQKIIIDQYQRLRQEQNKLLSSNAQMTRSNNYLAQSFGYIRNRIVYALTLGAITNFAKQLVEVRGQYELLERSLGVLLNSFERGSQVFQKLNQMAIESPFTLMELAGAAKQLTAYNFAADEVVETTRRLADISAALGVPMERLTYNLGQIRAQTVLNARDARDFANAGLPIVKSLSDYYTELEGKIVSTGDVYERMSKKMVSYNDVMAVINKMTDDGGKFFEFQAKQAETLRVQMANLTLAWNNMLNEMGERNQTALTLPLKALKNILQNWDSFNRVLKNIILSFGLLKAAQLVVLKQTLGLSWGLAATAVAGKGVAAAFASIGKSIGALFTNPWTWVFVGVLAITDFIGKLRAARQATIELNEEIKKGAAEASQANLDFLNNKGNQATRDLAKENKLSAEQGAKAWESIEEQIKTSSMAASQFLSELWAIDDVNERVKKGFDYVENIQRAQAALQDLKAESAIVVTQDKGWFGLLGEGLVQDLKDLKEDLNGISGGVAMFDDEGKLKDVSESFIEYRDELEKTATSINNFIKDHNITDPFEIREILERVKASIKEKNPEIKGELATLFDVTLDQRMMFLTNKAIDQNTSLWAMFMERLKHNSSTAFQDITSDIYKKTGSLTQKQQAAVDENLEYFKRTMPYYYEAIENMVKDASQLRINIGVAFNVQKLTDFQNEVNKRINSKFGQLQGDQFNAFLPTQNDNLTSWVKTQQDAIEKLRADNKLYEKDKSDFSKNQIAANNTEIEQRRTLLSLFNQSEKKEKNNSNNRKKDVLGDSLKKEVELIDNIQKRFKEYQKMGVDAQTSIKKATDEYGDTLQKTNSILNKYGFKTMSGKQLANMDLRGVRDYLKSLLDVAIALGNARGVEALEKELAKINVEITKIDYKKITDGLNNELGKLKDEYELAVELDANPELGSMFAEMFGIDTNSLPRTFGEAFDKANEIVKSKMRELNLNAQGFNLMQSNIKPDENNKWMGLDFDSEPVKQILKWQKTFRDEFKNNIVETEKMLDDYVKKYGDYSDKIAEIETNRLNNIKALNEAYYTEEMRKLPEYTAKLNAIENGAEKEKQKVDFDDFKDSRYYTMMFENLDYISTKTLRDMRERLRDYIDTAKDLQPEQLKTLLDQYEKIEQKIVKRRPFKTLAKDLKAYFKESKQRKAANDAFKTAQKEYDVQKKIVSELKVKQKQAKANSNTSQSYLDFLAIEINGEQEILDLLKQQLDAAEEKANKYNLTAKLAKSEALAVAQVVGENLKGLAELRDQMNELFGIDASKGETLLGHKIDGYIDGLSKVSDGISKITTSAQSGNVFGVVGGVVDVFTGIGDSIASIFGGGSAKTRKINKEINRSVETVRKLNLAYQQLEQTVNKAMGSQETAARRSAIANKEAQLAELEKQMQLEKSKRSKDRDNDAIKQYEENIQSLRFEIEDLKDDLVNNLAGDDIKSAAEQFVDAWVDAWKAGEVTLDAITEKMDEMVYNLIKKAATSRIVGAILDPLYKSIDDYSKASSAGGVDFTTDEIKALAALGSELGIKINEALGAFYGNLENLGVISKTIKDNGLSALQAGISGITEDQAGALEAYMNGVSQQVYLHSDLLTQIRDAVVGFDIDVQTATMSQMLLQLQTNYQVMQSMAAMMENWTNAAGNGIRVELLN